ncbi:hypothetical protein N8084_01415 [Pelagibacteraceae bacterium]|jgi:hypothetical protein|nr:hypothetical protein [Pelagibacteraceae bacterium]
MKIIKFFLIILFLSSINSFVYAEEKADCSKISSSTLVGNLKNFLCKRGSDKIDADGNFKKGFWKRNKNNK